MGDIWHKEVSLLSIFATLAHLTTARRFTKSADAVKLNSISALTFHKNRETTHRRVPALPQLTCVSGSGCSFYEPESIRCTNSGSSYDASSVEWTCSASLPTEFKLGSTEVVCEGYESPDDEFILKGSCALEYRLLLTDVGSERFGGQIKENRLTGDDNGAFWLSAAFWCLFAAVGLWIVYSLIRGIFNPQQYRGPQPRDDRRGWRGGWDDDNDDNDPPPPYTPYSDPFSARTSKPKAKRAGSYRAGSNRAESSRSAGTRNQTQTNQRPWWQSFGAGAAAGGAAGYMAANASSNQRDRDLRAREERVQMREQQGGGRSWLGSLMGGGGAGAARPGPPRAYGGGGGGVPGGPGRLDYLDRYDSTGFGGTRRR